MISVEDARQRIPDGKSLYSALVRNQRLMPPRKDAINSQKFMRGVWTKKYWVMSSHEVVGYKMCADPPSKKQLARILAGVLANYRSLGEPIDSGMRRTAKQIRKRPPNTNWMLLVLSSLHPGHEVFDKGYIKPARRQEEQFVASAMVDNEDGFFDGLPMATPTGKRRINLLSADMQQQVKVARLQFQLGKLQEKLDRAQGVEQAGPSQ